MQNIKLIFFNLIVSKIQVALEPVLPKNAELITKNNLNVTYFARERGRRVPFKDPLNIPSGLLFRGLKEISKWVVQIQLKQTLS